MMGRVNVMMGKPNGADPCGTQEVTTPANAVLVPLDAGDIVELHAFLADWIEEFDEAPEWLLRVYRALGEVYA